ncbi:hypothetical protein ACIBL8_18710 [Streptomyces sp. NPDC050523]|uniref:hypothetical protein n=1 Tax=Streptomyces sp. NPDC050523 TaxID=3365622 RepID=UPI00379F66AE
MILDGWPAQDATFVRYGLRRLLYRLPFDVVATSFGLAAIWLVVRGGLSVIGWMVVALMLGVGVVGVVQIAFRWRARRWVTAFDATGFWWMRGKEVAVIRWDSLAGVGIYWARGRNTRIHSVELCPSHEIDRDDPLLWQFVRDTDPLRPGLPRLRYRIDVGDSHAAYEKALRQWAPPGLWFGRKEQPLSYAGSPDQTGHRERTAEGTDTRAVEGTDTVTRETRAALVFDAVVIDEKVVVSHSIVLQRRRLGVALVMALLCTWAVRVLRPWQGNDTGALLRQGLAVAVTLLTAWALALLARSAWGDWDRRIVMDSAGVHVTRHGEAATVPWDSLAGAGIYASPGLHTLELCPKGEIDRDDPLLWPYVRDDEPLRPGLPRLRHRMAVWPGPSRHAVAEACRTWAPELWLGGRRMPSGYEGKADRKGHLQRTRGAGLTLRR